MAFGVQQVVGEADAPSEAAIDVAVERERTLGTRSRHYFNAAGAGLISQNVIQCMIEHLRQEEQYGAYEAANLVAHDIEELYTSAAELLGCDADEISLHDTATTGLRVVFDALRLGEGDTVIASRSSYVSQALRLLTLEKLDGVTLRVIDNAPDGTVDLVALETALMQAPGAIISAVHVPTSSGLVEPVLSIGELARRHGATYILDATQSVGQIDIDVRSIGCDVLVATGRKFLRGPRGTAFNYVRRGFLETLEPWAPDVRGSIWSGQDQWTTPVSARSLETWEAATAGRLGLGVAIREAIQRGMPETERFIATGAARLRSALGAVDGVTVVDPPAATSGIVTFMVDGADARAVSRELRQRGIDTIAIPATHAQWDLGLRGFDAVVRASVHVYNDQADFDAIVAAMTEIAPSLRGVVE